MRYKDDDFEWGSENIEGHYLFICTFPTQFGLGYFKVEILRYAGIDEKYYLPMAEEAFKKQVNSLSSGSETSIIVDPAPPSDESGGVDGVKTNVIFDSSVVFDPSDESSVIDEIRVRCFTFEIRMDGPYDLTNKDVVKSLQIDALAKVDIIIKDLQAYFGHEGAVPAAA